jgi:hypothetical protein
MRARLAAVAGLAALTAAAMPAHAAKSVTLSFDRSGNCGTDTTDLVVGGAAGHECNSARVGTKGTGLNLTEESYVNSGRKAVGYKVDASRKITGKLNLVCTGPLAGVANLPGYAGAEVTISINGVTVGTVSGSGPITAPGGSIAVPVNLTVPKSLNGKVVKSVQAAVTFTDGLGICGMGISAPAGSSFSIPSK